MSDDLEALPPLGGLALRALEAERARGDVDPGMHERVLGRVMASVAIGAAVTAVAATAQAAGATGATGATGAAGTGATGATGAATAAAGTATAAGATGAAATATGLTLKTAPWILAAFVVGGGVGAAVHAAVAPSSTTTPSVGGSATVPSTGPSLVSSNASAAPSVAEAPPPVPITALPSVPAARTTASASAEAAPATSATTAAAAASAGNDVDLAAERSLVDRARTALGRGQIGDALAALDAHGARYPHGRLVEEREALAVDALARSGRMDLARARAARFRAAYPNSVFLGVVDAALAPR